MEESQTSTVIVSDEYSATSLQPEEVLSPASQMQATKLALLQEECAKRFQLPVTKRDRGEHRVSCHMCGNIRKNISICSSRVCPQIYCRNCIAKALEQHGQDAFMNGCPLCKRLCCCSLSKTSPTCLNKYHCYRKCAVAKRLESGDPTKTPEQPPHRDILPLWHEPHCQCSKDFIDRNMHLIENTDARATAGASSPLQPPRFTRPHPQQEITIGEGANAFGYSPLAHAQLLTSPPRVIRQPKLTRKRSVEVASGEESLHSQRAVTLTVPARGAMLPSVPHPLALAGTAVVAPLALEPAALDRKASDEDELVHISMASTPPPGSVAEYPPVTSNNGSTVGTLPLFTGTTTSASTNYIYTTYPPMLSTNSIMQEPNLLPLQTQAESEYSIDTSPNTSSTTYFGSAGTFFDQCEEEFRKGLKKQNMDIIVSRYEQSLRK